ncbi:hypothetical protein DL762_002875 [Monosporascus cannonballus]|uniref:Cation/H+ exchanger transmembrane domain-containing protein n=1 Tax=Monosporascus cannonballus TaxID=155416 RepID=A0ABY0HEZ2_9PEZI|nr:hypothetical protein DL762_002875 [Monosporascus cannonballus]
MPWLDLSDFNVVCSRSSLGVALGPYAADFVRPERFGNVEYILLEFARLTLAVGLVDALALGACVTPTDPVLSMSIVKGRYAREYVPQHMRLIISAEAGANDGFGYPYLFLALYLSRYATGTAIEGGSFADLESVQVYGIVVAIFLLGTCGMLGIDDLLACFVAGNVFTWNDWFRQVTQDDALQSTMDYLLNATFFAFLGAMMPWEDYKLQFMTPWRYIVIAICLLIFKRLPPLLVLYRIVPQIRSFKEAAFVGHFGPIGVAAIYYSGIVVRYLEERPGELGQSEERLRSTVRPVIYSVVVASIIAHGLTIPLYNFLGHFPDSIRHPIKSTKAAWRPHPRLRLLEFEDQINGEVEKWMRSGHNWIFGSGDRTSRTTGDSGVDNQV